jgi:hypothetical protein
MLNSLAQMTNSPLFKKAQEMSYGKSAEEIQQIARNICNQRGVDYDAALTEFKSFLQKQS